MIQIKSRWKRLAGRDRWAARRAALVAKTKATKAVWFPPKFVGDGTSPASTAKTTTTAPTQKTTKAPAKAPAKKTAKAPAKKTAKAPTKKSTGAAKKPTNGTEP